MVSMPFCLASLTSFAGLWWGQHTRGSLYASYLTSPAGLRRISFSSWSPSLGTRSVWLVLLIPSFAEIIQAILNGLFSADSLPVKFGHDFADLSLHCFLNKPFWWLNFQINHFRHIFNQSFNFRNLLLQPIGLLANLIQFIMWQIKVLRYIIAYILDRLQISPQHVWQPLTFRLRYIG